MACEKQVTPVPTVTEGGMGVLSIILSGHAADIKTIRRYAFEIQEA